MEKLWNLNFFFSFYILYFSIFTKKMGQNYLIILKVLSRIFLSERKKYEYRAAWKYLPSLH